MNTLNYLLTKFLKNQFCSHNVQCIEISQGEYMKLNFYDLDIPLFYKINQYNKEYINWSINEVL